MPIDSRATALPSAMPGAITSANSFECEVIGRRRFSLAGSALADCRGYAEIAGHKETSISRRSPMFENASPRNAPARRRA